VVTPLAVAGSVQKYLVYHYLYRQNRPVFRAQSMHKSAAMLPFTVWCKWKKRPDSGEMAESGPATEKGREKDALDKAFFWTAFGTVC